MIPYRWRSYTAPDSPQGKFDESAYTAELHEQNLRLLEQAVATHAPDGEQTPWLTSGIGVVAVRRSGAQCDVSSVCLADDGMQFAEGLHFVRQDVAVHVQRGIKARTRVYPTFGRLLKQLTSSDAAWTMMYPTLNHHPERASEHLKEWLTAVHELQPATPESLAEIFPLRPKALKHWVGVRLG